MPKMISVLPSFSARQRACMGSVIFVANLPPKLPLTGAGNFVGLMSGA